MRSMHMPSKGCCFLVLAGGDPQFGQNSALTGFPRFAAGFSQNFELPLQAFELFDSGLDVTDMLIQKIIHVGAVFVR